MSECDMGAYSGFRGKRLGSGSIFWHHQCAAEALKPPLPGHGKRLSSLMRWQAAQPPFPRTPGPPRQEGTLVANCAVTLR